MKVHLLSADHDFDADAELPAQADALTADLGLEVVWRAMARDDEYLHDVARRVTLMSLGSPEEIRYRQAILADALAAPEVVRRMYEIAVEAIDQERRLWGGFLSKRYPDSALTRSVGALELLMAQLARLREIAAEHRGAARSDGLGRLFEMLLAELGELFRDEVSEHLRRLRFPQGVLVSAGLGAGNKGADYVLREPNVRKLGWTEWRDWKERFGIGVDGRFVVQVSDRDEAGMHALQELRARGVALVAGALQQSTDHVVSFFRMLRAELAFYVGCLNLHEQLASAGAPTCLPEPEPAGRATLRALGLYDLGLRLSTADPVVANDVEAAGRRLILITGPNRGGKSVFLRSLGLAQLMMQCGMFVPAASFAADVRDGLFTHFKREEDASMRSGKLDEELRRMRTIVDGAGPRSMVLLNESFASTNEREGSQIGRQVVTALLDAGVKAVYVTHLYDLADGLRRDRADDGLFLRAERRADGERTFRILPGEPQPTSHGADLYQRIFTPPAPSGGAGRSAAAGA